MKDYIKKNKIIVFLVVILFFLLGFIISPFAQKLAYKPKITSSGKDWNIVFTGAETKEASSGAKENVKPSYNALTGNIDVSLSYPGDYIVYDFTVTNLGKLNAKLESINIVPQNNQNDTLIFETSNFNVGDELHANESKHIYVKCYYKNNQNKNIKNSKNVEIILNFVQKNWLSKIKYDIIIIRIRRVYNA